MKINKHIEIVRSTTEGLSSLGQKSCDMISSILKQYYERVGVTIVNNEHDLEMLVNKCPDLVFLGVKNIPVEARANQDTISKLWLSAYLDAHGLNYTGSTADAIALDFDKPAAKQVVKAAGLKTSDYFMASQGQYRSINELPLNFPVFIKPPNAGGGKGIGADSVVRDFAAFAHKVRSIASNFGSNALVEDYLPGREFSVAILETTLSEDMLAMPVELITERNEQGDRILGLNIKARDTEHVIAIQDPTTKHLVTTLAVDAFRALGARDYGRIDIRLDANGLPHFLEANLIPGVAFHDFTSYFTSACWINQAMSHETMILHIAELGLSRDVVSDEKARDLDLQNSTAAFAFKTAFEPV